MSEELSYVLITPYSLRKSRTGGIVSRLLSRTGLQLVAGRMFAPSPELANRFADLMVTESDTESKSRQTQELIRDYIRKAFSPDDLGTRQRVLLLVFKGEDAVLKTRVIAGPIGVERTSGETIRDTYGDYVVEDGKVVYFEPGVLVAQDEKSAKEHLRLWTEYSDTDGGLLDDTVIFPAGENIEKTLVLIKPDNFRFPNGRPGGVIDLFSRTGLYIIGFKVHHMSVGEAMKFYGPVLDVVMDKLKEPTGKRAKLAVEQEFGVPLSDESETQLGELLGPIIGRNHWETIIQFMAGSRPSQCDDTAKARPGTEKCVAIVYQGINAVQKIREVLGPTDPSKAPSGTIRREFGQSIMINAAHASDSPDNAAREMEIISLRENNLRPLINAMVD